MTMSPRLRWVARIGGYALLALVTFVFALHLTFPYERIRDRALEQLASKYDVTIGGVERSWVPGRFALTAVTLKSRPAVAGQTTTTMYFKRIEIDLAFVPLLSSKVEIGLDISTGAGSIRGTITQQKAETTVDLRLTRVPLTTIPGISDAVGLPMGGNADGKVKLKISKGDWSKAAGTFDLSCTVGCTVGDGVTKIYPKTTKPGQEAWAKDGVAVPTIKINRFRIGIDIAKGEAKRRAFELSSTDGEADVDFNIKLARSVNDSTITGCIKYKCSKELYDRERNFRVQCDFGSPVVDAEGFHHIKLLGKASNPRRIGALCDGQSDRPVVDPLSAVPSDRPRLDVPVAETQPDAGLEVDASVAPPPVDPVMSRPRDDVPPPPPATEGIDPGKLSPPPMPEVPQQPPVIDNGNGGAAPGTAVPPGAGRGGGGVPQDGVRGGLQPEGVAPPTGNQEPIQR